MKLMIRCKSGRPMSTTIIEDELMYYFNKVDESKHYSATELLDILKLDITKRSLYGKISNIAKKCEKDKEYLQYIKDTYSKYSTINEALTDLGTTQPIIENNQIDSKANISNTVFPVPFPASITNTNMFLRDVSFNLVEIRKMLMSMKQTFNSSEAISTETNIKEDIVRALKTITNYVAIICKSNQSTDNKLTDIDNRLSTLENNVLTILDVLQELEDKINLEDSQPINSYKNTNTIEALSFDVK